MIRPVGPDDQAIQVLSNEGAMCGDWGPTEQHTEPQDGERP